MNFPKLTNVVKLQKFKSIAHILTPLAPLNKFPELIETYEESVSNNIQATMAAVHLSLRYSK